MMPPVACWPDRAAVTFHYNDMSVRYHHDPATGVVTPLDRIPLVNVARVVLWLDRHPLMEVTVGPEQRPIFTRLESDKPGIAKAYLVGWQQTVAGQSIQSIGYYLPPCSSSPGRIVVAGKRTASIVDQFSEPDFRQAPPPCWPDSTTYSYYYRDGKRLDRIDRATGEETTSENMPRVGLKKIVLWHHDLPVVEQHYHPGQQAVFRRRNEHRGDSSVTVTPYGVPMEALMASTNWFANKKAVAEGKFMAYYLLGWQQKVGERNIQSVTYFYPQNGQIPPRVVLGGRFQEDGEQYLPIPVGKDLEVIT